MLRQVNTIQEVILSNDAFIKIYSRRLNETIILLSDEAFIEKHSGTYALYRIHEIEWLRNLSQEEFIKQHKIRKEFTCIPLRASEQRLQPSTSIYREA